MFYYCFRILGGEQFGVTSNGSQDLLSALLTGIGLIPRVHREPYQMLGLRPMLGHGKHFTCSAIAPAPINAILIK